MTTTPGSKNLELSVTNFGPIARAIIDLRPLTVFVGPSNTGKSYMAVLTYALHQFFNAGSSNADFIIPDTQLLAGWMQSPTLSKNDISPIYNLSKQMFLDLEKDVSIELPEPIADLVRKSLENVPILSKIFDKEITRCFGIDKAESLIRHSSGGRAGFSLHGNGSKEAGRNLAFGYDFTVTKRGTELDVLIPKNMPLQIDRKSIIDPTLTWLNSAEARKKGTGEQLVEGAMIGLLRMLARAVIPGIVGPLSRPAYYLPADRAGVMHAHQVAVRGLIASASRTVLRRDSPMPVISGVLGDFLEQLVALASSSARREPEGDNDLALRMEQALLRGTVRVERSEIEYPSFVYRPDGWNKDLPLMNASSMVSELAPVVLYLRHVVQPGDLLIIEEPESHLHPAMQVEFVRQLAATVRSGVRILITTHSEWILEELANLVRLSELSAENREGIDFADLELCPEEIGAWLFERGPEIGGSVVREIPLDVESGTFPAGFGLITEGLYNRWGDISNRIGER